MLIKKDLTKDYFSGYNQVENYWKMLGQGLYGQRLDGQRQDGQQQDGLNSTKNNRMEKTPYLYSKGVIVVY